MPAGALLALNQTKNVELVGIEMTRSLVTKTKSKQSTGMTRQTKTKSNPSTEMNENLGTNAQLSIGMMMMTKKDESAEKKEKEEKQRKC